MSYTASITITVPAALYSVACAVARALDPDVGGAVITTGEPDHSSV